MAGIEAWEKIFKAAEDEVFLAELRYSESKYEAFGEALGYGEPKYESAPQRLQRFSPIEGEKMPWLEQEKAYMLYEKLLSREEEAEDARRRYGERDKVLWSLGETAGSFEERMVRIFNPIREGFFAEIYTAEEAGKDYPDFYIKERERESLVRTFEREKEKSDMRRFLQRDNEEEERAAITKIASEKREALLTVRDEEHVKGGETKIEVIREKTRERDIDMDSVTDLLTERIVDLMQRSPDGIYR